MASSAHDAQRLVESGDAGVTTADGLAGSVSTALAILALVQCRLDELSAAEARLAMSRPDHEAGRGSTRRRKHPCPLSSRELEVLMALSDGKVYKEIAHDLSLSPSTVRSHVHHAYAKLGVPDRAQAVLLATRRGWI